MQNNGTKNAETLHPKRKKCFQNAEILHSDHVRTVASAGCVSWEIENSSIAEISALRICTHVKIVYVKISHQVREERQ